MLIANRLRNKGSHRGSHNSLSDAPHRRMGHRSHGGVPFFYLNRERFALIACRLRGRSDSRQVHPLFAKESAQSVGVNAQVILQVLKELAHPLFEGVILFVTIFEGVTSVRSGVVSGGGGVKAIHIPDQIENISRLEIGVNQLQTGVQINVSAFDVQKGVFSIHVFDFCGSSPGACAVP